MITRSRTLPIGAEILSGRATHFRVWAPAARSVVLQIETNQGGVRSRVSLEPEAEGYYSVEAGDAPAGTLYRFLLDGEGPFADPASRFQPSGPGGPSMVVDPFRYRWRDRRWKGPSLPNAVLYECHIGTLTTEGTWNAAEAVLPSLRDLGVSILEVMPVAEFPGR